jgi:hypothetical protein
MALGALKILVFLAKAPAGPVCQTPKISNPTNHIRPAEGGAFILPSMVGASPPA